jgi:hypothetical protein
MSDISNQLIKDSYNYVLQSDLSTGVVYRIGGGIPVNPTFLSGITINSTFTFADGSEANGYVLTSDASGNATWKPVTGSTPSSGVTSITVGNGLSADSSTGAVTIVFTGSTGISGEYLPLSGGTVTGNTIFNSGLTATTISATTYYNLPDNVTGYYLPLSGGTVTGDTIFNSGLTATTISAATYLNVNAVTGGSYSNGTITLSGTGNVNGNTITGLTKYFISASTPTGVTIYNGDRWYNTNNGIELVYINDGDSQQWVQPSNTPGPPGYSNLMITTGITTSAATLDININYYGVNYNGQVNLTLPNPSGYDGYNFTIKDEGGYAATHRIRLIPSSGLIDGNNYVDINLRYVALHLMARNNNWWII